MQNMTTLAPDIAIPSAGYTTDEFAAALRYHPESIRRLVRAGRIHALKFGRTWRIPHAVAERIAREGLPT